MTIVQAAREAQADAAFTAGALPRHVTLELTARRDADGPLTPQHFVPLDRDDISLDLALDIVGQLGVDGDTLLTLGGLGDALLYEHWQNVVTAARDAGVLGICIETDLLGDRSVIDRLLTSPVDVVSVRINADTAETYRSQMLNSTDVDDGKDCFTTITDNLQHLLQERNRRWQATADTTDEPSVSASANNSRPWLESPASGPTPPAVGLTE